MGYRNMHFSDAPDNAPSRFYSCFISHSIDIVLAVVKTQQLFLGVFRFFEYMFLLHLL